MDLYESLQQGLAEDVLQRFPEFHVTIVKESPATDTPDYIYFWVGNLSGSLVIFLEEAEIDLYEGPAEEQDRLLTLKLADPGCFEKLFTAIAGRWGMTRTQADFEAVVRAMGAGAATARQISEASGLKPSAVRNILYKFTDHFSVTGKLGRRENTWQYNPTP